VWYIVYRNNYCTTFSVHIIFHRSVLNVMALCLHRNLDNPSITLSGKLFDYSVFTSFQETYIAPLQDYLQRSALHPIPRTVFRLEQNVTLMAVSMGCSAIGSTFQIAGLAKKKEKGMALHNRRLRPRDIKLSLSRRSERTKVLDAHGSAAELLQVSTGHTHTHTHEAATDQRRDPASENCRKGSRCQTSCVLAVTCPNLWM